MKIYQKQNTHNGAATIREYKIFGVTVLRREISTNGTKKLYFFNIKIREKRGITSMSKAILGRRSYIVTDTFSPYIANPETTIGSFTSIGMDVHIGHGVHPTNYLSTSPYFYLDRLYYKNKDTPSHNEYESMEPVHIGNDVWIGSGVFIKNGITIGDGAIVGAHAVVTKDVPPYAIVCGNPARIIRYRFSDDIIKQLLELKWWNLPDDIIKQIPYDDVYKAIEFLKSKVQ